MSEKTYLNVRILVLTLFIIYCFPSFTMGEKDELERIIILGFPGGSDSKESTCCEGDLGSIPGSGRSPGKWLSSSSSSKDKWMFILQDGLRAHLLCGIWNIQQIMKTCWNVFDRLLECWLCYMVLSLHGVKKDLLPGTSVKETGCVCLCFIAHSFLGPQSSDMR